MESCTINSPLGHTKISGNDEGVSSISIVDFEDKISETIPEPLQKCAEQLMAYFENSLKVFDLKLNPKGTEFQKKVWKQLETIPYGKTISYLELSKQLGDAKAIRAVASANGKNPLWIVVPCHRVIGR